MLWERRMCEWAMYSFSHERKNTAKLFRDDPFMHTVRSGQQVIEAKKQTPGVVFQFANKLQRRRPESKRLTKYAFLHTRNGIHGRKVLLVRKIRTLWCRINTSIVCQQFRTELSSHAAWSAQIQCSVVDLRSNQKCREGKTRSLLHITDMNF